MDAMNFGMFVDNIKYTLEDLYYTRDNGYERGISNVFVKNLKYQHVKDQYIAPIKKGYNLCKR